MEYIKYPTSNDVYSVHIKYSVCTLTGRQYTFSISKLMWNLNVTHCIMYSYPGNVAHSATDEGKADSAFFCHPSVILNDKYIIIIFSGQLGFSLRMC